MPFNPTVKICGLTRPEDAQTALQAGADYFGMLFYPQSPRCVSVQQAKAILAVIPADKSVAVTVMPSVENLIELKRLGFSCFQIHFDMDTPLEQIAQWARVVKPQQLWPAPRLKPGSSLPLALLDQADTFLIDSYSKQHYGGSGRTGDWSGFYHLQKAYPQKTWILAGGLNPVNAAKALEIAQARFIDVNSGVERAPGVKSADKIHALFNRLRSH